MPVKVLESIVSPPLLIWTRHTEYRGSPWPSHGGFNPKFKNCDYY